MTQSRGERDTCCSTLAQRVASRALDFGQGCQITFGIPQTPIEDSCRPPDITLITETFFWHQQANSNWVWTSLACEGKEMIASFVHQTGFWYVLVSFLDETYYNILREAESAVLTLLVLTKNILYIISAENSLWAALEIRSNTHIGTMEIWKMPTFFLRKELICCFPWRRHYWKDWFC